MTYCLVFQTLCAYSRSNNLLGNRIDKEASDQQPDPIPASPHPIRTRTKKAQADSPGQFIPQVRNPAKARTFQGCELKQKEDSTRANQQLARSTPAPPPPDTSPQAAHVAVLPGFPSTRSQKRTNIFRKERSSESEVCPRRECSLIRL